MNPADLFTKHLLGEDKIKSLVKLLSCEFRGGRAATAPKLRSPDAAATQELLAADEYYIQHEDRTYLAVEYEGEFVVEAYAHTHDVLPHLHRNLDSLFPRAIAKEEETEGEDATPCGSEQRGEALGKAVAATTTKTPTTGATTTTKPTTVATTTTTTTVDHRAGGKGNATGKEHSRVSDPSSG